MNSLKPREERQRLLYYHHLIFSSQNVLAISSYDEFMIIIKGILNKCDRSVKKTVL